MSGNQLNATKQQGFQLNTIDEAIRDIKAGKVIIVVDDERPYGRGCR